MPVTKYPDKEALRKRLLANGLRLLHDNGYKDTSVYDIVRSVKISKGVFYSLFPSKEVFVLQALLSLHDTFLAIVAKETAKKHLSVSRQYRNIVNAAVDRTDVFFLKQPEQVEVFANLGDDNRREYARSEKRFYRQVVRLFGKDPAVCDPGVLGNLIMLGFLVIHSGPHIPALFMDSLAGTVKGMIEAVANYIDTH